MRWMFERAALLLALLVVYCARLVVENLLLLPVVLALDLLGLRPRSRVVRTPDARFENLPGYNFKPNYTEIGGLRVHYIDEVPSSSGSQA